jgi:hypothetical protein
MWASKITERASRKNVLASREPDSRASRNAAYLSSLTADNQLDFAAVTAQLYLLKRDAGDKPMRLKNEVAVITGGASGIGRETALLFAHEGAPVVAADVDDASGRQAVQAIQQAGGAAIFVHADVTLEPDVVSMFNAAEDAYERVSIVFNNAGG